MEDRRRQTAFYKEHRLLCRLRGARERKGRRQSGGYCSESDNGFKWLRPSAVQERRPILELF